jgi:acetyl esterase
MPALDPQMAAILAEYQAAGLVAYETLSAAEARLENERRNAYWNADAPPLPVIEDLTIEGPRGPLKLRLYVPEAAAADGPAVVYLHGGGWVFGSLDTHDGICRRLALAGGLKVVAVDYALAPEHPFPQGLADAKAAVRWLVEHGHTLDIDPARLAIAGDSAGANLALAACLRLRDLGEPHLRAAGLVYGAFSADLDTATHAAFGDGRYLLATATMRWMWDQYVPDPAARADPLATPLNADLRGLPPLFVAAAELDPLREDSIQLARRLLDVGAELDFRLWRGVTHACLGMSRRLDRVPGFITDLAGFLARRLG